MAFELSALPYAFDALEPYIDAQTMEIHHGKHHAAYVANLNGAVEGSDLEGKSLEEIFKSIGSTSAAIRNNGGGHFNHTLFWSIMSGRGGGEATGALRDEINKKWGSFDEFKTVFSKAGATRFGSGWAWLCVDPDKNLCVCSTPNQDNPMMDIAECPGVPVLGLDVWEHAYYLKYQNRRPDYISAFWNVINWNEVSARYSDAV
ncbi:superoxide dismutase [Bacteroidota bacterium]